MKSTHAERVEKLREKLLQRKDEKGIFSLSREKSSNTMREGEYKKNSLNLDLSDFHHILEINVREKTALVEPKVTMEMLFLETSRLGLIPKVLPEFKGITVGGAINGAAIESSSFRYGQFNDTCLEYEVILGDGSLITLSQENYPELFYGLSGSYGSLGIITQVKIALMESKPFVHLHYERMDSISQAAIKMEALSKEESIDFIEGIAFSKSEVILVIGRMASTLPKNIPTLDLSKTYSPWYYLHVAEVLKKGVREEKITLADFLFRHDRAAFWMGGYALNAKLLFRYLLKLSKVNNSFLKKMLQEKKGEDLSPLKKAPFLFRLLFGWIMDSKKLYKILHSGTEKWFMEHFCIQDYYLPKENVESFAETIFSNFKIAPLWLCPVSSTKTPQLFAPHSSQKEQLFFDVGVYGKPREHSGKKAVRMLDLLCYKQEGKKMLYSYTFLEEEEFWKEYPKEEYQALRKQFNADVAFHPITVKVLESST